MTTRNSCTDYITYIKNKENKNIYNRGIGFYNKAITLGPIGNTNADVYYLLALNCFKNVLVLNKNDQDAKYYVQILSILNTDC